MRMDIEDFNIEHEAEDGLLTIYKREGGQSFVMTILDETVVTGVAVSIDGKGVNFGEKMTIREFAKRVSLPNHKTLKGE